MGNRKAEFPEKQKDISQEEETGGLERGKLLNVTLYTQTHRWGNDKIKGFIE